MTPGVGRIVLEGFAALGTWPAFGILMLLCFLFFGYLVPKAKAPIFANVGTMLPRKVLDEYSSRPSGRMGEPPIAASI